jgi:hypothetical protein
LVQTSRVRKGRYNKDGHSLSKHQSVLLFLVHITHDRMYFYYHHLYKSAGGYSELLSRRHLLYQHLTRFPQRASSEDADVTESITTPIRSFNRLQRVEIVYRRLFHKLSIDMTSGDNAPGPDVLKSNPNRTSYPGVLMHARYTCSVDLSYLPLIYAKDVV